MRVSVDEIKDPGIVRTWDLTRSSVEAIVSEGTGQLGAAEGAVFEARLKRVGTKVLLDGRLVVKLLGRCRRCLADMAQDWPVEFRLTLIPRSEIEPDEDRRHGEKEGEPMDASFDLDSVDEELFEGREIDLAPLLREQILLSIPVDLLCSDQCRGLCPVCGQNLNEAECGCETQRVDPRWDALKRIKIS